MAQNETISALDWMSLLPDDRLLSLLSVSGTHESCALYKYIFSYDAKCQNLGLRSQLHTGVRCLDIRLKLEKGVLKAYHGIVDQKITFDEIVSICSEFLKEHNGECILMFIKKEGGDDIGGTIREKIGRNPNLWYIDNYIPTLGEVRGKIVLLRRFSFKDTLGINLYEGWQDNKEFSISSPPNGIFYIQDKYHPGNAIYGLNSKWDAVKNMLNNCNSDTNEAHWYVNFISAYCSIIPNIKPVADFINPKVENFLETPGLKRCGVLMMDFVEESDPVVQRIINLNYQPYSGANCRYYPWSKGAVSCNSPFVNRLNF